MSERHKYIGKSINRIEDHRFLTGTGCFVDDVISPNMANMAILRSSHAHAHINNINLSAAYESDGVIDVFSSGDLGFNQPEIPIRLAPLAGFENFLQHPLAEGKVRYVGEPLAVVVAEDRYLAEDALSKIQVDYEILDAVTNIDDALTDTIILHDRPSTNIATSYTVGRGILIVHLKKRHISEKKNLQPIATRHVRLKRVDLLQNLMK